MPVSIMRTAVVPVVAMLALVCGCSDDGGASEDSKAKKSTSSPPAESPSISDRPVVAATGPHHLEELGDVLRRDGRAALTSYRESWPDHQQRVIRDGTERIPCEEGGERFEFEAEGSVDPDDVPDRILTDMFPISVLVGFGDEYRGDKGLYEAEKGKPEVYVLTRLAALSPYKGATFTVTVYRTAKEYHVLGETDCVK